MKTMTKEEWFAQGEKLYGKDLFKWRFKCPSCGHVQTPEDFRPYKDQGATPDTARFNCIGRYDGNGETPMFSKPGPCNYTSGGLLNISPLIVKDGDNEHRCFAFADDDSV